ncbi:uncharacterized protein B0T15DRAFT_559532 [Chaetomium strumarium]|uniref:Mid2 domain-containing protein n=1 Tax=Chaetomium strumarium TaxID=1170767 RepID=A0AAJ0GN08_9PEZI|nr:hypothetical protein B0T15DRAFT_559532 [Chaetomium strumarium]
MVRLSVLSVVAWAASLALASYSPAPLVGIRTRNLPGTSDEDTIHLLLRRLAEVAHEKRETVFKNSTTLEGSWNEAILFSQEIPLNSSVEELEAAISVEVKCSTCYFKAGATAELNITGSFDLGNATQNITAQIGEELKNLTDTSVAAIKTIADQVWDELGDLVDGDLSTKFSFEEAFSFDNVTIDTDIDIVLPPLPEVQLLFQIDYLDLYVAIDTTIAAEATLTLPLFKTPVNTPFGPLGISISPDLEIGIFVTIDLILSVEGEISLRSGFHLLVEEPIGFKIAMFSSDVSDVIFNGGKFEFLPVTILSGEVALKGVLRVGMHAGFDISSDKLLVGNPFDKTEWTVTAGVEVGVFAHVAEFLTNITGGAEQAAAAEEKGCAVRVVQEYTLALGAVAGATLAVADHTWAESPATTVPIFYTTLADVCAVTVTTTTTTPSTTLLLPPSSPTGVAARQAPPNTDLTTTTISTRALFTATSCLSPGLILCPQSLQTTSVQTKTLALVTAVPAGVEATFPQTTAPTVASTIPFGKAANTLTATSGSPVSYVAPPPPPSSSPSASASGKGGIGGVVDDIGEVFDGETGGVSNKLIIGLSVGLGVPFVLAVISGLVYWLRRRRYTPVPKSDMTAVEYTGGLGGAGGAGGAYDSPMAAEREGMLKKGPAVTITVQH